MTTTVTPTFDDVFTALRTLIQAIIGTDVEVIQGIVNRAAMPIGGFVVMTMLYSERLATNIDSWDYTALAPTIINATMSTKLSIQIDAYGPNSSDWAAMLATLLRDDYACIALAPTCQPLYVDDPRMMPLLDSEQQYEQRWMIGAMIQYNPTVSPLQDYANALTVGLFNIDETFPPT